MGRRVLTLDVSNEAIAEAYERLDKNMAAVSRELGITTMIIKHRLNEMGLYVCKRKKPGMVIRETAETTGAYGMCIPKDHIDTFFDLKPGKKIYVPVRGKIVVREITKVNPHNVETKNRYGRVECFTKGDIVVCYNKIKNGEKEDN